MDHAARPTRHTTHHPIDPVPRRRTPHTPPGLNGPSDSDRTPDSTAALGDASSPPGGPLDSHPLETRSGRLAPWLSPDAWALQTVFVAAAWPTAANLVSEKVFAIHGSPVFSRHPWLAAALRLGSANLLELASSNRASSRSGHPGLRSVACSSGGVRRGCA